LGFSFAEALIQVVIFLLELLGDGIDGGLAGSPGSSVLSLLPQIRILSLEVGGEGSGERGKIEIRFM
jgi:hypothetical protein